MGFFDNLKKNFQSEVNKTVNASAKEAGRAVQNAVSSKSVTFTFTELPKNVEELKALPESALDTPFKTTALALAALCNYEKDTEATYGMLDFLKGPDTVSEYEKQFYKERLTGKCYKVFSFFAGATVENGYKPSVPYTVTVTANAYSYPEENRATMWVQSSGADSLRSVKLRQKPSTGQWFITEIQCLSDIRIPAAEDPWA